MDLYDTKSRIAEAFVEAIFRRARFEVCPFRDPQAALRIGREDFSPNFTISPRDVAPDPPRYIVEVKYRPAVDQFLALENQRRESSLFTLMRRSWPGLYFVIVTDHPVGGRSCFQAIAFGDAVAPPFTTVDLVELSELKIYPHNVEEHEQLLLRLFGLLTRT